MTIHCVGRECVIQHTACISQWVLPTFRLVSWLVPPSESLGTHWFVFMSVVFTVMNCIAVRAAQRWKRVLSGVVSLLSLEVFMQRSAIPSDVGTIGPLRSLLPLDFCPQGRDLCLRTSYLYLPQLGQVEPAY